MRWRDFDWRAGWLDWRRKRFWAWMSVIAYALLLGVVAPWVLRDTLVDTVHTQLGRDARLENVDLNPFVLSVRLEGFAMNDVDGGTLTAFDDLYVNFRLSSLFRWARTFAEVRLTNPSVRVVRDEAGALNLRGGRVFEHLGLRLRSRFSQVAIPGATAQGSHQRRGGGSPAPARP